MYFSVLNCFCVFFSCDLQYLVTSVALYNVSQDKLSQSIHTQFLTNWQDFSAKTTHVRVHCLLKNSKHFDNGYSKMVAETSILLLDSQYNSRSRLLICPILIGSFVNRLRLKVVKRGPIAWQPAPGC